MTVRRLRIYLGDLSYFNRYSSSMITIPLNIGYIAAYVRNQFEESVEVSLFNDPEVLLERAKHTPPDILGLSSYFWNERLGGLVARKIKATAPGCLVVIGGPNVDSDPGMQKELFDSYGGHAEILVLNEGELGFAGIVRGVLGDGAVQLFASPIDGCVHFGGADEPVVGRDVGLTLDLATLPSPILGGILDEFLVAEYMPMIQTSRMCPYSCSFCSSGKLKGKLRVFPEETVREEVRYIARRYIDAPHRTLFITDENFGINKRDNRIAEHIVAARDEFGYPRQTFCYFDKKMTPGLKEAALAFGEMNAGGLQLAAQSFNDDALKAVKRKNMTNDEMVAAVNWAHDHGLKTSSEMIFGLPFETKQSFLGSLEYLMKVGIDTIAAHNLFLLKGIELNRREEREKFALETRFRPSFACSYGTVDGEFSCESEEIVVASSHFSFADFLEIRKVSLMFYIANVTEYFKKVFRYLLENDQDVIPLFEALMNPGPEFEGDVDYIQFVADFTAAAVEELHATHDAVASRLESLFRANGDSVAAPSRLNVLFASRLIYRETWFARVLQALIARLPLSDDQKAVARDLILWSDAEWIDIRNPGTGKDLVLSRETLAYLDHAVIGPAVTVGVGLRSSPDQADRIRKYNEQYDCGDETSYYYNVLDIIQPRRALRYEVVVVGA